MNAPSELHRLAQNYPERAMSRLRGLTAVKRPGRFAVVTAISDVIAEVVCEAQKNVNREREWDLENWILVGLHNTLLGMAMDASEYPHCASVEGANKGLELFFKYLRVRTHMNYLLQRNILLILGLLVTLTGHLVNRIRRRWDPAEFEQYIRYNIEGKIPRKYRNDPELSRASRFLARAESLYAVLWEKLQTAPDIYFFDRDAYVQRLNETTYSLFSLHAQCQCVSLFRFVVFKLLTHAQPR